MTKQPTTAEPRPKLKGIVHALGACGFIPLILGIHDLAANERLKLGVVIYGCSLVGLLTVSAAYHGLPWPAGLHRHLRRLDRSMIYMLIAGTMTPVCLGFHTIIPTWFFSMIWIGAAAGVILSVGWPEGTQTIPEHLLCHLWALCARTATDTDFGLRHHPGHFDPARQPRVHHRRVHLCAREAESLALEPSNTTNSFIPMWFARPIYISKPLSKSVWSLVLDVEGETP